MLMKRATAYCSFCSQVILLYLHPFHCNSLLCSRNCQKITKNTYFWNFKVIDVGIPKQLVAIASYDNGHICAYLEPFSR